MISFDVPTKIIHIVCRYFNVKVSDVKGLMKCDKIVKPRRYSIYFIWKYTSMTQEEIVQYFAGKSLDGRRERSIVSHCKKVIHDKTDQQSKNEFMALSALIENEIYS